MSDDPGRACSELLWRISLARPGQTGNSIALEIARDCPGMDVGTIRDVLIENNGRLESCDVGPNGAVCIELSRLSEADRRIWTSQRREIPQIVRSLSSETRCLVYDAPDLIEPFSRFSDFCTHNRFCTGPRVRQAMGFAAAGVGAHASVVRTYLADIARASDALHADIRTQFRASRSPFGVARSELGQLERFLHSNPHYEAIRHKVAALPRFIRSRLGPTDLPTGPVANARWTRSQILIPKAIGNPAAYLGRGAVVLVGAMVAGVGLGIYGASRGVEMGRYLYDMFSGLVELPLLAAF